MAEWHRVKSIFEEVIELPVAERAGALGSLCAGDGELCTAVERLLASHEEAGAFLGAPTLDGGAAANVSQQSGELPERIGAYTPVEVIGEGGFGTVYRARQDVPVRRVVALKVIKPGMDTREVIARFAGERQALAMMSHPNIASVLDAGATAAGRPFFVMEYVPGEPITRYCDRHSLSLAERLDLFSQVCHAVQHAHQKGIIHRDLKPSNVLVVPPDDGEGSTGGARAVAKVIDFGVAKATEQRLTEHSIMTLDGVLVGTPEYMSPEQAEPGETDIDTRTDIYSLGVLLYELVTGTLPFGRRTLRRKAIGEIQRIVREVDPPRPSHRLSTLARRATTRAAGVAESEGAADDDDGSVAEIAARRHSEPRNLIRRVRGDLDWIVMKCLEKDRSRRYETANGIAMEIERYLRDEPVLAGPPGAGYRVGKFVRRHRVMVTAASVAAAALVIGLTVSIIGLRAAVRSRKVANHQKQLAQDSEADARREARKAEAVNEFLRGMLAQADPRQSARREMTVRAALDKAVARLDSGEMKDEPEIEADIRLTIGRSYSGLAQFEAAVQQITKAAEAYRKLKGSASDAFAKALHERGAAYKLAGRAVDGEADLRAALQIERDRGDAGAAEAAACANDLALTLIDQKRFDEARSLLEEVYKYAKQPANADGKLLPEAVNNLGSLFMAKGEFAKAEPYFREAIEINTKRHGEVHPDVATNYDNLAQALQGEKDLDGALAAFQKALAMRRKLFGNDHPDLATTLHNLAVLHYVRGELPECEKALRESLAIFRRAYGLAHPDTLTVNDSLVSVVGGQGRYKEAESLLLEAFNAVRDEPSIDVGRKRALATRLSQLYAAMGKPEESAEWKKTSEQIVASSAKGSEAAPGKTASAEGGGRPVESAASAGADSENP